MSTPILWYKMNESIIGVDSSGSGINMTNAGVVSFNDPVYGPVADFTNGVLNLDASSVPSQMIGTSSRSYSFWIKLASSQQNFVHGIGDDIGTGRKMYVFVNSDDKVYATYFNISASASTGTVTVGEWTHIVSQFNDTGDVVQVYVNGSLDVSESKSLNIISSDFTIGNFGGTLTPKFDGLMQDFRVYGDVLTSTEVSDLYTSGPGDKSLVLTMYTHIADAAWQSVTGASSYTLTMSENGAAETTLLSATTDLTFSAENLTPDTSYEFFLYTDLDPSVRVSKTESTSEVNAVTVGELLTRLSNDVTELSVAVVDEIQDLIPSALLTGDTLESEFNTLTFVANSESFTVPVTGLNILTPFVPSSGSGQSITLNVKAVDSSITYDETLDEISVDATSYSVGDRFVLNGMKIEVKEL